MITRREKHGKGTRDVEYDVLARHAALVTRNLLTALIEQVERDQSEEAQESDEESSPPHEPGGREAPATIRIPNNLQS